MEPPEAGDSTTSPDFKILSSKLCLDEQKQADFLRKTVSAVDIAKIFSN